MSFSKSQHTNASGSSFTDVGGDYIVVNNFITVPASFIEHPSRDFDFSQLDGAEACSNTRAQVSSGLTSTLVSWPVLLQNPSKHPSSPLGLQTVTSSQLIRIEITPSNDISACLIIKIVELLVHPDCSYHYQDLHQELESLQKMLALTGLAIKACENMPLGHTLVSSINWEVDGCSVVLQALLGKIKCYRENLSLTPISYLWRRVLAASNSSEIGSLTALRRRLSVHLKSLGQCLMALKLLSWMTDVNRSRAGCPSLRNFYAFLEQGGDSLRYIQVNAALVVDHLGRNIPIPTIFCSDWKSVDYIINRYCENTIGSDFIRRGEYRIIRAHDNKVIERSKFASTASPEMKFEISIVMRQTKRFTKRCPQCGKSNYSVAVICGWIKCRHCSKQFEVITKSCPRCRNLNLNISVHDNWIECRKCAGQFQLQEDDLLGAGVQEMVSTALRTGKVKRMSSSEDQQECGNDSAQFFRLIHLVYPRNRVRSSGRIHLYL